MTTYNGTLIIRRHKDGGVQSYVGRYARIKDNACSVPSVLSESTQYKRGLSKNECWSILTDEGCLDGCRWQNGNDVSWLLNVLLLNTPTCGLQREDDKMVED